MTLRQRMLLLFWREYTDTHGIPPTIREAATATNISSTSVCTYNLARLVELGHLIHVPGQSRAYRLAEGR